MKNKIIFKIIRLPIPWVIRIYISKFISFIKFKSKKKSYTEDEIYAYKNLNKNGYHVQENFLNDTQVSLISNKLKDLKISNPWKNPEIKFCYDNPPKNTHVGYYDISDLKNINEIIELTKNDFITSVASKYLGKNIICTNIASWWTFGNNKFPEEAENFHRDIDNIAWVKVFIYLTDTDISSGAHAYVPKSHRKNKNLTFKRFSDKYIKNNIGEIKYMEGEKGTLILEDTFGFHKGQHIIENKNRLILQFQYSVINNPY